MTSAFPSEVGGIDTYDKLIEYITRELARDDLSHRVPDWIRLTEIDLQRDCNLREQEYIEKGTFNQVDNFIDLPVDLLIPRMMRVFADNWYHLDIVSMDKWIDVASNGDLLGKERPLAAAHVGNRLYLAPTPNQPDDWELFYLGAIKQLSAKNQVNKILLNAPDCLIYGALLHSAPWIGDDQRIQLWGSLYSTYKESFKRMEWRSRTGGGTLRVRPDISVDDRHNIGGS